MRKSSTVIAAATALAATTIAVAAGGPAARADAGRLPHGRARADRDAWPAAPRRSPAAQRAAARSPRAAG